MRYTVTKQRIDVVGNIWMPYDALCTQSRDLSDYDLENIGDLHDRDAVSRWIDTHFGDFSSIKDFRADFHVGAEHIVHDWQSEESELVFADATSEE